MVGNLGLGPMEVDVPYSPANPLLYRKIVDVLEESNGLVPESRDPVYLHANAYDLGDYASGSYEFSDFSDEPSGSLLVQNLRNLEGSIILLIAPAYRTKDNPDYSLEGCMNIVKTKRKTYKFNEGIIIEPRGKYTLLTNKNAYLLDSFWNNEKPGAAPILITSPELNDLKEYQNDMRLYMNRLKYHGLMSHSRGRKIA